MTMKRLNDRRCALRNERLDTPSLLALLHLSRRIISNMSLLELQYSLKVSLAFVLAMHVNKDSWMILEDFADKLGASMLPTSKPYISVVLRGSSRQSSHRVILSLVLKAGLS